MLGWKHQRWTTNSHLPIYDIGCLLLSQSEAVPGMHMWVGVFLFGDILGGVQYTLKYLMFKNDELNETIQ